MTHLRRIAMPKTFPLKRKGREKYVISSVGNAKTIPLLLILRDICKLTKTRKEAKMLLRAGEILVNGKKTDNERFIVHLFDVITITKLSKSYKVIMKSNKFALEEIKGKENITRICKIIGKKLLSKGKVQINLDNGYNIISDLKAAANDSVVFDFKTSKIVKHLPLKEKADVEVIWGTYIGLKGIVNKIKGTVAEIKTDKKIIEMPIKNIRVIENEK